MKKSISLLLAVVLPLIFLAGCAPAVTPPAEQDAPDTSLSSVGFEGDALYAVAYLGYNENGELAQYTAEYLDGAALPVHHVSGGEYYLIIPRYADMSMSLSVNRMEGGEPDLRYETPSASPFVLQCNASDIFADAALTFTHEGETAEFTPFISLKDGSVDVGTRGQNITK